MSSLRYIRIPYIALVLLIIAALAAPAASIASAAEFNSTAYQQVSSDTENFIIVVNKTFKMPIVLSKIKGLCKIKEVHSGAGIVIASGPAYVEELLKEVGDVAIAKDYKVQFLPPPQELKAVTESSNVTADPYFPYQWDMMYINATPDKAWSVTHGSKEVKVAILDTGVCWYHPDIAPNYDFELSTSFVNVSTVEGINDTSPMDYYGHGTWCAGCVAAALNGIGVAGVAPNVTIVNVKVLTAEGWGYWSWLLEGILYCADHGIDVISMSLGGYLNLTDPNDRAIYLAFMKAVLYARMKGCLVVAAAGNEGLDLLDTFAKDKLVEVPAMLPRVIAVSAMTDRYELAPYSNYGSGVIDVTAPGGYWYDYPNGTWRLHLCLNCWSPESIVLPAYYVFMAGTSAATPHVAGVAALILSINHDLPPFVVESIIKLTATDLGPKGYDQYFGFGLVDAYGAVQFTKSAMTPHIHLKVKAKIKH